MEHCQNSSDDREPSLHAGSEKDSLGAESASEWNGLDVSKNPRNFSNARKWTIILTAFLGTLLIPMNGTSITAATDQIDLYFHISDDPFPNSYWTVTAWSLGGVAFLLVGLALMEDLGVRRAFLGLHVFFILMIIPQALAKNYATLIVSRVFTGGAVSLLANAAASIIPDLWATERERSLPVSIWILCYLLGNTLGPPIFAGIMQPTGNWRWIFYAQLIIYGALLPIFWLFLRETRSSVIVTRLARQHPEAKAKGTSPAISSHERARAAVRPVYLICTEPALLAITLWSGFSFGLVYLFTQSVAQVYALYGWNEYNISYVQIAVAIGEVLGFLAAVFGTHLYFASAARNTESPGHPIPEARLYVAVFGSFVGIAGGMFIYAWTTTLPWYVPSIGLIFVGFGIQTVVSAAADYIEDAYASSNYAASAISACAAGENIFAGCLPLATSKMYRDLGDHWASTLLGLLAVLLSFAPVFIIWKGRSLRERSPFMLSQGQTYVTK